MNLDIRSRRIHGWKEIRLNHTKLESLLVSINDWSSPANWPLFSGTSI
jgi:hypothetical protein